MRTELPEFPKDRRARYVTELGLSDYDANQLTATKVTSDSVSYTHLDVYKRQVYMMLLRMIIVSFGWISDTIQPFRERI